MKQAIGITLGILLVAGIISIGTLDSVEAQGKKQNNPLWCYDHVGANGLIGPLCTDNNSEIFDGKKDCNDARAADPSAVIGETCYRHSRGTN